MGLAKFLEDTERPVSSVDLTEDHSQDMYLPSPDVADALRNRARELAASRAELAAKKPESIKAEDIRGAMESFELLITDCVKACVRDESDEAIESVLEMKAVIPGVQRMADMAMLLCGVGGELRKKESGIVPLGDQ